MSNDGDDDVGMEMRGSEPSGNGGDDKDDGKVVSLSKKRREKKEKEGGNKKPSMFEIIMPYVGSLLGRPDAEYELGGKFVALVDRKGMVLPAVVVAGDVLVTVTKEMVINKMIHFSINNNIGVKPLDPQLADKAYRVWAGAADAVAMDDVPSVKQLSDPGYCWGRLPYDLDSRAECPTFDEMFSRMSNSNAVLAFIGGLFDETSSREQFVFMYGDGGNGKGRLIAFLLNVLGHAATIASVPKGDSGKRWFNSVVFNKRLVGFGECDDFKFATGTEIKELTGDEFILVEQKQLPAYQARAKCKFFFASNIRPDVDRVAAHKRRMIYSEIAPIADKAVGPGVYNKRLVAEGHAFLSKAWRKYKQLSDEGGTIAVEEDVFEGVLRFNEEGFQEILDQWCVIDEEGYAYQSQFTQLLKAANIPPSAIRSFKSFLSQKYEIKRRPMRCKKQNGKVVCAFWGIRVVDDAPLEAGRLVAKGDGDRF